MEQEKSVMGMRMVFYVIVYGLFGYVLERIINFVAYGYWFDNRILTLPVQPMYGLGVVFALIIFGAMKRFPIKDRVRVILLFPIAILTTAVSEWMSGEAYYLLTGDILWDYGLTFSMCDYPYVCSVPTSFFGILSAFTILYIHPFIDRMSRRIPTWVEPLVIGLVFLDIVVTYTRMIIERF